MFQAALFGIFKMSAEGGEWHRLLGFSQPSELIPERARVHGS